MAEQRIKIQRMFRRLKKKKNQGGLAVRDIKTHYKTSKQD